MDDELDQFLSRFAECFDPPLVKLRADNTLMGLRDFDSLARISVLAMIDSDYGVQLAQDVLDTCKTVGDLFELIRKRQND